MTATLQVTVKVWSRMYYRIRTYELPVESLKIEHKAVRPSVLFLVTRLEVSTDKSHNTQKNHTLIVL